MVDYANIPRDSRRVPIATKVQFKFDRFSGFISEYSANLSPTGMFIVSEKPEPVGRILDLEFRLGDGFEIITGQAEVVWARTVPDGPLRPPGMGIRFLELSPGCQELIYRIVDQYVAQGGIPFDLTGVRPAPSPPEPELPPLAREPDPFPELEPDRDPSGTVLPWSPFQSKETAMAGGELLPPLEPLDDIFRLEENPASPAQAPTPAAKAASLGQPVLPFPVPAPAPAPEPSPAATVSDPFPPLDQDLDLTQAGPTSMGFDEPLPDTPPSYSGAAAPPPPGGDIFAAYLPQQAAPVEAPPVRPLSTLAGGASVRQPRSLTPWFLLAGLLALAAAGFFLRDDIPGWLGLGGGDDETIVAQQAPQTPAREPATAPPPPPPTLQEETNLTSDMAGASAPEPSPAVAAGATEAPAEPAAPALPEVVQRRPAPTPAPAPAAGPAATAVERITFEQAPGGTTVVLWGNGSLRNESFRRLSVEDPPREVIQIRGVRQGFEPTRIPVGTSEVQQIRVGYHQKPGGNELHVVIDLAGSRVRVARVEPDGQRLRIHLQAQ